MKTYTLTPTRWREDHTIESCAESEADLWSISWEDKRFVGIIQATAGGWLADFPKHERQTAEDFCAWLRNREQVRTLLHSIPSKED